MKRENSAAAATAATAVAAAKAELDQAKTEEVKVKVNGKVGGPFSGSGSVPKYKTVGFTSLPNGGGWLQVAVTTNADGPSGHGAPLLSICSHPLSRPPLQTLCENITKVKWRCSRLTWSATTSGRLSCGCCHREHRPRPGQAAAGHAHSAQDQDGLRLQRVGVGGGLRALHARHVGHDLR